MLRQLSSSDSRFVTLDFRSGLNVLVADITAASTDTDSRNGVGKSSVIELLHFLLGGSGDRTSLPASKALRDTTFRLRMDWPGIKEQLIVERSASRAKVVGLNPLPPGAQIQELIYSGSVDLAEWQRLLERYLFGLPPEHGGVSGRGMLAFLMRRVRSHGFNSPTRSNSRQADVDATTNLAYLLGLDWSLADRYRSLKDREAMSGQLRKAASDPILGRIVGRASELRGQIAVAEHRVKSLREEIASFRVVPEYENLRGRADEIDLRIRELRNSDAVDRRNLADLERAIEETIDPEINYLERTYAELGVVLSDQIRRSFSEVAEFHDSVVRNRRRYLGEETSTIRARLESRENERQRLGAELASALRTLNEGGALDALTTMQQVLAQEQAMLSALRHRYEAAQSLEADRRGLTQDRISLQQQMEADIDERRQIVDEAVVLFAEYAKTLYGDNREAYLRIEPGRRSLSIHPHIESDDSGGIGNMVVFCFDLTVSVLAHRAGRGPDFLVHDSHLFDPVDERQVARALNLAANVAQQENMQYIVSLNSDELAKAERRGFDSSGHVLERRLTDAFDSGGLFGFRF